MSRSAASPHGLVTYWRQRRAFYMRMARKSRRAEVRAHCVRSAREGTTFLLQAKREAAAMVRS